MKRLPILAGSFALLASISSAQADYSFLIDDSATNFHWSGTTSLGDIVAQPPNFTLVGDTVLTLDTGGSPVGTGAFADAGDALIFPNLHGEIPNIFPWLPPLVEIDIEDAHVAFLSPTFSVSGTGAYSTTARVRFISGVAKIKDISGGNNVIDLAGMISDPEPISGSVTWSAGEYHLDTTVFAQFDFDSGTGITGMITIDGSLIADHAPELPVAYCPGAPNSVGPGAVLGYQGSTSIGNADLLLHTTGLPANQFGLHFYGPTQVDVPFGNGKRCVGPPLVRLKPINTGSAGEIMEVIDNDLLPGEGKLAVGMTRHFQCWYRDPAGGGAQFNLSNGLTVAFTP